MLIRTREAKTGKKLARTQSLMLGARAGYVRPKDGTKEWWQTTTTVWRVDEMIRRQVRDWKRLMGEDGHTGSRAETFRADHDSVYTATHSVFPAPLVEWILLRYGGPPGGKVLDAFAGGPPRAVVASMMGYHYTGFDIRLEQIDENTSLLQRLKLDGVTYVHGDGQYMEGLKENSYDVGLTCPPYHDLEQYSDLPNDLSNMSSYAEFRAGMAINADAYYRMLKPKAFMCLVVGPFRGKTGELMDFPGHMVEDYREAGFLYWQQIILSKNFGSAAKRATNAWRGHKLVPCHEFLLVFRKPE